MTGFRRKAPISFIMLGMLSACSSDDTYLPALLADPMAEYEAEGIELVDRDTQGYVAKDVLKHGSGQRAVEVSHI